MYLKPLGIRTLIINFSLLLAWQWERLVTAMQ